MCQIKLLVLVWLEHFFVLFLDHGAILQLPQIVLLLTARMNAQTNWCSTMNINKHNTASNVKQDTKRSNSLGGGLAGGHLISVA